MFIKAVLATVLKPGMVILESLLYTFLNFRAPPTSGMGVVIASIASSQKSAVFSSTISDENIATPLDFFSKRGGVPIKPKALGVFEWW